MSRRPIPVLIIGTILTLAVAACSSAGTSASAGATTAASVAASAAAGGGVCTASDQPGTVKAAMDGRAFVPGTITAKVGDVIAFTNGDPVSHSATLDDGSCTTKRLGKGETGALVFTAAGTYPFHCIVHPDMKGTIEVTG
jgi:plastocyanin